MCSKYHLLPETKAAARMETSGMAMQVEGGNFVILCSKLFCYCNDTNVQNVLLFYAKV